MAKHGPNWLELAGMSGNGLKWLEMAGNDMKWLEIAERIVMAGNG